jgi:glycosyltransferase involved in cell wall biosynthesis
VAKIHPKYLLVTHIPFARTATGEILVDALWARDLQGLAGCGWAVRICAPEIARADKLKSWGPGTTALPANERLEFVGFPPLERRIDVWKWISIRNVLRREVVRADLIHTSNCFAPYQGLAYAHDLAVRLHKKTLFVIAEDFYDMLEWEWIRTGSSQFEIQRRYRQLAVLDRRARLSASTADLTFLHTPAAVQRYRNSARNGIAIRQPGHEQEDVIPLAEFEQKCAGIAAGASIQIVAACRHKPLKGLDFLIAAIHMLARRGIRVSAKLYGDGPQTESLQRSIQSLQLGDRVCLPGVLAPGTDVYRAIAAGHLFLMPHRTTDFGRAFFDAMAGAAPVIAFRTPASIDTVRDGVDGLICPLDDVEALADAIARFHTDRQYLIRCAVNARERALTNTRSMWHQLRADWTRELLNERTIRG